MTSGAATGDTSSILGRAFLIIGFHPGFAATPLPALTAPLYFIESGSALQARPVAAPAIKPPMWAKYATPSPPPNGPNWPNNPKSTCMPNQNGMYISTGMRTVVMKNAAIIVKMLALGYITRYAPSTPEIAPDAPTAGMLPSPAETAIALCKSAAAMPHPRYSKMYFTLPYLSSMLSPNTNRKIMLPKMWAMPPCMNIEVKIVGMPRAGSLMITSGTDPYW